MGIQPRGGFVQNKNFRLVKQRPGNVDAPALAAGELAQGPLQQVAEFQQSRQLCEPVFKGPALDAVQGRPAAQIVPDGQLPVQHRVLKHHAQLPPDAVRLPVQVRPADDHAAAVLAQLAAQDVDGGGFPRAVHSQKGEQLSLFHAEVQILHRLHIPKGLVQMADLHDIIHIYFPHRFANTAQPFVLIQRSSSTHAASVTAAKAAINAI